MKTVIIEINGAFPDTELLKTATVTIEGRTYTGTVRVIALSEDEMVATKVTLEGPGLKVANP